MANWDEILMEVAKTFAKKSKDRSTKVGAAIVDANKNVRALAYNGLPRNVTHASERRLRPLKYLYTSHAEENAICSCARIGIPTEGCSLYVTSMIPCSNCARLIIQAGIIEVVVETMKTPKRWRESADAALKMFNEAGVVIREIEK